MNNVDNIDKIGRHANVNKPDIERKIYTYMCKLQKLNLEKQRVE